MNKKITLSALILTAAVLLVLIRFAGIKTINKIRSMDQSLQDIKSALLIPNGQEILSNKANNMNKIYDNLTEKTLKLRIWENDLDIDLSYNQQTYDLSTFTSEFPVNIQILNPPFEIENLNIFLNNQPIGNSLHLQPFNHEDVLTLDIYEKGSKNHRKYFINVLNSQFPHFTAAQSDKNLEQQGVLYGDILRYKNENPNRLKFIYKMDLSGKILYYKAHHNEIIDFKKTIIAGQKYYSYLVKNPRGAGLKDPAYFPTDFIIMNQNYQIIDSPKLQMPGTAALENHDALILGPSHYLLSGYIQEIATNFPQSMQDIKSQRITANVLQEVKDGKVLWTWKSSDFPELYSMSNYDYHSAPFADYAHFNSMIVDPKDQNLIVSFRHLDAILKIERYTGKILWILGGKKDQFNLNSQQVFSHQHYAQLTPSGSLTIFDNGNAKNLTRILEFHLDEANKKVRDFASFSCNNYFSPYCGSTQKIADKVFMIGWGGGDFTARENASIIDFAEKKKKFELLFDGNIDTYRIIFDSP